MKINKYNKYLDPKKNKYFYPLLEKGLSDDDLNKGINVLKTGFITMNKETEKFEKEFSKAVKSKYSLMVNSGSSANLLAAFAACNPLRKNKFKIGDEALIPALCWSTSLWPLVQTGLIPKFIDANPDTLNVNADEVIKKITKKTKVIMLVNVLGISTDIKKITNYAKKRNIIVIEDNCEALGAKFQNKYLGTYGDFGTYSFFYSHQITCGEGGMIVCNNKDDYKILLSLRSHGWSRGKNVYQENAKKYPNLDPRYIFINSGFNLRPTDIQAAIAHNQFNRLNDLKKFRNINRNLLIEKITKSKKWNNQFQFISVPKNIDPSWMGLPILLSEKYKKKKQKFVDFLDSQGIETRPIISGNFANQPAAKLYKICKKDEKFENAQKVQDLGFLIGLHTKKLSKNNLKLIHDAFFMIDHI